MESYLSAGHVGLLSALTYLVLQTFAIWKQPPSDGARGHGGILLDDFGLLVNVRGQQLSHTTNVGLIDVLGLLVAWCVWIRAPNPAVGSKSGEWRNAS